MSPTKPRPRSEVAKKLPKLDWGTFEKISQWKIINRGTKTPKADDPNHEFVKYRHDNPSPRCCQLQECTTALRKGCRVERRLGLKHLLKPNFGEMHQRGVELFLGGRGVFNFWQCAVLPEIVPTSQQDFQEDGRELSWASAIGFIDTRDALDRNWRNDPYRVPPNRGNSRAFNVFWKWMRKINSAEALHSYIVFAMIAIGQYQQHQCRIINKRPNSYQVRLLFQRPDERDHLYLYEAYIPATLLTTLKNDVKIDQIKWPTIDCKRVRYEPVHQFYDAFCRMVMPDQYPESRSEEVGETSDQGSTM